MKAACPSADQVDHLIVVDIGGNKYRLIVEVFFRDQDLLFRHVLTREEYDKGKWKACGSGSRSVSRHGDSFNNP
jgi:mRNA interferase HigB